MIFDPLFPTYYERRMCSRAGAFALPLFPHLFVQQAAAAQRTEDTRTRAAVVQALLAQPKPRLTIPG